MGATNFEVPTDYFVERIPYHLKEMRFTGNIRPQFGKNYRISPHEYEKTGRKFYKMAAEHGAAEKIELCEVFWDLHHHFQMVKKPLNFIADHYLRYRRDDLFAC